MPWIFGAIVTVAAAIVVEWKSLKQKKLKKERWMFFILLSIGVGMAFVIALHLNPNPLNWLAAIYKPFWVIWMKLFG